MAAEPHPDPVPASRMRGSRRTGDNSARALAILFLIALALLGPFRKPVFPSPFTRLTTEQSAHALEGWTASVPKAAGAVFSLDRSVRGAMWGTLLRGDGAYEGEVLISGPAPDSRMLVVPVSGRTSAPNSLKLRALDSDGKLLRVIEHPGRDFGVAVGRWDVEMPERAAKVELVLVDATTGPGAWLGVGRPGTGAHDTAWLLTRPNVNTGFFLVHVIAIVGFLFLPGIALSRWKGFGGLPVATLPLPGMALMALGGIALWTGGSIPGFAIGYGILNAAFAVFVLLRRAGEQDPDHVRSCTLYGMLVVTVLAWSLVPLPVERELFEGTNARARMVASPPDCAIPFETAAYFLRAHEGVAREHFVGGEWSITSRGPLTAWMITTAFKVFGTTPGDPPMTAPQSWPADPEGYFIARIIGILTNALVILAAGAAISALAGGYTGGVWFGIGWVALSPVLFINTAFLWPKMLATFFGMLAIIEVGGRRRSWVVGAWLALSYLSHPVGVLIAAPVCLWLGAMSWSGGSNLRERVLRYVRAAFPAGMWMIAFAAPWLVYKAIEGKPDVFFRYPLGDGHGYAAAKSFGSWLACRWDNFIYSLVPGTLWHSKLMLKWAHENLSTVGHIAMNYQKVLPLGIGLAMAPVAVWQLFRRSPLLLCSFRRWVIAAGFALMLIVWGYSHDALGRNCMEPVVVFVMIAAAASMTRVALVHRVLLGIVAIEQLALLTFAFVGDPGFEFASLQSPVLQQIIATGVVFVWFAWIAIKGEPGEIADEAR